MTRLDELEKKSIYIIREVASRFKNPALLWSIGKDSTTMLWLCKKAFYDKIPFKLLHIDTGYKFKEIYEYRDRYAKEWGFDLIVSKNEDADKLGVTPDKSKFECCNMRKTEALKKAVREQGFDALIVGIRRDEHGIRNKERYFSPRDNDFHWNLVKEKENKQEGDSPFESLQDIEFAGWDLYATEYEDGTNHVRIHPILHWTEQDIWDYIKRENIPIIDLYFAKEGKRFRSIGCECCCKPVDSNADDIDKIVEELKTTKVQERSGRDQDKEDAYNMQKLRSLGYM